MTTYQTDSNAHTDSYYDTQFDEPLLEIEEAPLADPGKRLIARILDGILGLVSVLPGVFLMFSGEDSPLFGIGIMLALVGFLGFVVYQVVLMSKEGQTVAKRALKLRVVDYHDESNPGFARIVLLREIAMSILCSIPFLGILLWFADALFIFGEERRCIHDHLATTKVVDESSGVTTARADFF